MRVEEREKERRLMRGRECKEKKGYEENQGMSGRGKQRENARKKQKTREKNKGQKVEVNERQSSVGEL